MNILRFHGTDSKLYRLVAPLVMDQKVLKANNNYPFKTGEKFVWFVAMNRKTILGFVPVELKSGKRATINNYYVAATDKLRGDVFSALLTEIVNEFSTKEGWTLNAITLIQDKETFEKFGFRSQEKTWKRYAVMAKQ